MSFQGRSLDEREAASIVAGLYTTTTTATTGRGSGGSKSKKRVRDNAGGEEQRQSKKKSAARKPRSSAAAAAAAAASMAVAAAKKDPPMDATGLVFAQPELKPAPYFYYTDHSLEQDDDPLTPITAAGSVPTFPAKMHAILTNPDLADVVGWAPHGRSWRILKPRDFEIRVLPKYFEHSKFSSFVRQANGWGFRRMSQGYDKNAYYHEYFLRAMPWLCKKMRRPKVAEKKAVDPEMEPDLDAISRELIVVDRPPTREVLVLQKTIELGPKARMPVLWDTGTPPVAPASPALQAVENVVVPEVVVVEKLPPTLNHSRSYGDLKPAALPVANNPPPPQQTAAPVPQAAAASALLNMGNGLVQAANVVHQLPAAASMPTAPNHQNNTAPAAFTNNYATAAATPSIPAAAAATGIPPSASSGNLSSDSNFAAGFMAATAFHSNQIRSMFGNAFVAGMPIPDAASMGGMAAGMGMPPPPPTIAAPAAGAGSVNPIELGNALSLLQRAGMGAGMGHHPMQMAQNGFHYHHQAPSAAAASLQRHQQHQAAATPAPVYHYQAATPAPVYHHQAATPAATPAAASLQRHQHPSAAAAPPAVAAAYHHSQAAANPAAAYHHSQTTNPAMSSYAATTMVAPAAAAAAPRAATNNFNHHHGAINNTNIRGSQLQHAKKKKQQKPKSLSQQAMARLQKFQAYQASMDG